VSLAFFLSWIELGFVAIIVKKMRLQVQKAAERVKKSANEDFSGLVEAI
jgi:hypothetical protein